MGIEQARAELESEIASFHQGDLKRQPQDGTTEWWRLRALVLGLAYLKQAQRLEVHTDARESSNLYQASLSSFKGLDTALMSQIDTIGTATPPVVAKPV